MHYYKWFGIYVVQLTCLNSRIVCDLLPSTVYVRMPVPATAVRIANMDPGNRRLIDRDQIAAFSTCFREPCFM